MYMFHFIFLKGHPLHLAPSISWIRWFFWFFASVSRRRRSASALGATDQAMGSIGVEVSRLSPFRPAFRRRSASAFFFSSSNSCFFRSNKACRTFSAFKKKSPIRGSQSFFVVGWICQEKKYLKFECFSCLELYFVRLHLGDPTTCHLKKRSRTNRDIIWQLTAPILLLLLPWHGHLKLGLLMFFNTWPFPPSPTLHGGGTMWLSIVTQCTANVHWSFRAIAVRAFHNAILSWMTVAMRRDFHGQTWTSKGALTKKGSCNDAACLPHTDLAEFLTASILLSSSSLRLSSSFRRFSFSDASKQLPVTNCWKRWI